MTRIVEIETKRLLLRQWREDDLADFALLNSDPEVMEYLPINFKCGWWPLYSRAVFI